MTALATVARDHFTIAGRTVYDVDNLIGLVAATSGVFNSSFRNMQDSSSYSPAGGNKFVAIGIRYRNLGTGSGIEQLLYADAFIYDSGAGFTTPVHFDTSAATLELEQAATSDVFYEMYLHNWEVPASKFPGITSNGACVAQLFGYEVAV